MVKNNNVEWEKEPLENFLDEHVLYRGIHKNYLINWSDFNKIPPNVFSYKKDEKGISTDWSKYATPQFTLSHLRNPDLKDNGILEINVGNLKETIKGYNLPLIIEHNPLKLNRAHTLIIGINTKNKAKNRRHLSKISKWAKGFDPKF